MQYQIIKVQQYMQTSKKRMFRIFPFFQVKEANETLREDYIMKLHELQSFTKYLRKTQENKLEKIFEIAHYGKTSIAIFQEIFTSTNKIFGRRSKHEATIV